MSPIPIHNSIISFFFFFVLIKETGFSESDIRDVLKDTDFANEDLDNVLLHCKNPGSVGHAKLCKSGCKESEEEGSHSC